MPTEFEVEGRSDAAPFTLRVRRGEGMALLTMNWKDGKPPEDFVGFAIECRPPDGDRFFPLVNRLSFPTADGEVGASPKPTTLAPLQKFRWVHFPRDAEVDGEFVYRVTPVLMDDDDELRSGDAQTAAIALGGETYPEQLNVTFTRGFVSSQAFVDRYESAGPISSLLPKKAADGLDFQPTHPEATEALDWMGFEARRAILALLDRAIADKQAKVSVVAYDLSQAEVVSRLEQLGERLRVIVDDSGEHGESHSGETQAATRLAASAGAGNVKRQHMADLQHNKTIVVDGPQVQAVVCGSTNFSWRGLFVQANNAVVLQGKGPVAAFQDAFEAYWEHDDAEEFGATPSAELVDLELTGIDARVSFSPHLPGNAMLQTVADDIGDGAESSILYSLAFLHQTKGPIRQAIETVTEDGSIFVYGIADKEVDGIDLQKPDGNLAPVSFAALTKNVPEPFKSEPNSGPVGTRMHHKFVVIDFDKPTARVYLGSYNFSNPADTENGENLLVVNDRRIAVAYAVEALRIFDHYHFRVVSQEAKDSGKPLMLAKPPRKPGEKPWWDKYYSDPQRARDRELFA
ncbi:MAG TPA: phospholipase D-like domain-containing protein [Solirubrobacterales bacterium]|nr:phospholipase D-like domain-containing protein [Solirubrobacterales bacterium]